MRKETKQFIGYILFAYGIGSLSFAASPTSTSPEAGLVGWALNSTLAFILIILGSYLITLSQ